MSDLISRQAAISHVDDVPYIKEHPNVGLLWKAWIESLPSAQPEIIRCKDCKYATYDKSIDSYNCRNWGIDADEYTEANDFCSYGKKRDD